ncbi:MULTISPECIES: ABC transporter substrate-binding protein [Xanthobacter]|uniref:ABC transporter substrate-binding protein n=1 Tax=Xanthobacter flavus TaxID=281 RepID=A0A9W6CPE9_XANFL|nr:MULTISPECIES: ABC transporter substrate-binding protein [Xanthobacter]MBN8916769.1 ABC transporter substrate-binding protein [Hyphomicrobiales bacterium]MDR6335361.1 branched-chain amino acid transport system substrate-binding protein [Xanthobacter flavus]UDQ87801.1 ABC transporter substrate-binding protein [Xanthobacter autotrophicus]UJX46064.1 ABC transporter substrate-binding protein [Xanthobacter sp. YC-JY1]GLI24085.1 ABC transporter substrate-binding protein [Xanthobacter flavus]
MPTLTKRTVACSWLAATALSALAALPAAAQQPPIKVGFMTVRSGALAAGGKQMEQGMEYCLAERNGMMGGRKVELITVDTAGQPATTKTRAQELVERERVNAIIGPLAAFEALAIDDYIRQVGVPVISPSAAAEDLTQRKQNPWFVRAVGTSAQANHALGEYAAKDLKLKRVVTIGDDFAFGHEATAGFQRAFEDNGGKVVQKLWPPLNVADYGSYISQIRTDVDAVYAAFAGGNGLRFLQQYAEYGAPVKVIAQMTTVDEGILKSMGKEAVGVISSGWYTATQDVPGNKEFAAGIRAKYGADPGYYTAGAYAACAFLDAAVKAVDGKVEDKQALMKALRSVKLEKGPYGEVTLDEYGNPIMNVTIRKTEEKDGRLQNVVIKTYPKVTQFWIYDPKAFLADPVYSRDYPPAKNLGQ